MTLILNPATYIKTFSRKYRNRVCVPLDQDSFLEGVRHFLEENNIFFARVPVEKTKEIYYFFNNMEDTHKFLNEVSQSTTK